MREGAFELLPRVWWATVFGLTHYGLGTRHAIGDLPSLYPSQ